VAQQGRALSLARLAREVAALPSGFSLGGSLDPAVLDRLAALAAARDVAASVETGAGASTLLLSHASRSHTVFTVAGADGRLEPVRRSPLLRSDAVTFVEGPTQRTLPAHRFDAPLQLVLLDGPHAYPFPDLEYYYLYPHLDPGGLLVLDDIHIPTLHNLFRFLREDAMFRLVAAVGKTAFFERTAAAAFPALGDDWERQAYNRARFPLELDARGRELHPLGRLLRRARRAIVRRLRS